MPNPYFAAAAALAVFALGAWVFVGEPWWNRRCNERAAADEARFRAELDAIESQYREQP